MKIARSHFCRSYESDPLFPSEGEASQGEHPLTPFTIFLFTEEIFRSTFLKGPCIFEIARRGFSLVNKTNLE